RGFSATGFADQKTRALLVEAIFDRCAIARACQRGNIRDLGANIGHQVPAQVAQKLPITPVIRMLAKIELPTKLREQLLKIGGTAGRAFLVGNLGKATPKLLRFGRIARSKDALAVVEC